MASIFTMIINGDIPGHFVYRDEECAAFLSIEPLTEGHTLIVPITEVDHWIDLDPDLAAHLMAVAQRIGRAIDAVYSPRRVGLMIVGDEVPHVHIHVTPINSARDLDFAHAKSAKSEELAVVAARLTSALGV
jgi:histidine triad (HIT) family protein